MTRQIVWSNAARDDFIDIIRYVADANPTAAENLAARINLVIEGLASFSTGRPGRVTGTHEKVVPGSPYIVAYEVVDDASGGERIAVLRVIHGARDWPDEDWP